MRSKVDMARSDGDLLRPPDGLAGRARMGPPLAAYSHGDSDHGRLVLSAPGTRLGAYEVAAQIGDGGMGQVYRATDTSSNARSRSRSCRPRSRLTPIGSRVSSAKPKCSLR